MDSGNSGSMQSSSGGDDQEFDSRGESISSFMNAAPHQFGAISAAPPFLSHQNPNFFDPQSLDHGGAHSSNDNDLIWSRGLRSDHQAFSNLGNPSRLQPIPPPPPQQPRNPKKRTRASRRAPTTVLTTDTTNFRQMVQEFTGIPAAPFSGGSPYSRRLDLFSTASALRSSSHLDNLYPLRPAAQKILSPFSSPQPPHSLNPTMIDAIVPAAMITNPNNSIGASTSNNFHLPGDHNLFNIHQQPPSLQLGANAQMNFSNLSGFLSRDSGSDEMSRWKSRETARNNDNMVEFGGSNINSGESQNYNLNVAEKGMENVASSAAEGTVASWICQSD